MRINKIRKRSNDRLNEVERELHLMNVANDDPKIE